MAISYRRDIDGLRALAVLSVIFYHADFPGFGGGYLGVDIFFVISGYLISSIIMSGLRQNNFSFFHFYERRIRRILPALIATIILSLPFSWIVLTPADFIEFSQSIAFTLASLSNIFFWIKAGYFATATELKPLIHTWSLGIEEQFYFLFPVICFFLWRNFYQFFSIFLIVALFSSLMFAELISMTDQSSNFYLIQSRAWELLTGVLIAHLAVIKPVDIKNNFVIHQLIGLLLIFVSVAFFNEQTKHPSFITAIPIIGVSLLLRYSGTDSLVEKFLGNKILVGLGLISYSLYLVHHPIFSFMRHYHLSQPTQLDYVIYILLSILIAFGLFKFIETPFRNKKIIAGKIFWPTLFTIMSCLILFSFGGHFSRGFPDRFGSEFEQIFEAQKGIEPTIDGLKCHATFPNSVCIIGSQDEVEPDWALVGDSHAGSFSRTIDEMLKEIGAAAIQLTQGGCSYATGLTKKGLDCLELNKLIRSKIFSDEIKNIIIAGRYVRNLELEGFDNGEGGIEDSSEDLPYEPLEYKTEAERKLKVQTAYGSSIAELVSAGKNVFLIYPIPEVGWNVPLQHFKYKLHHVNDRITTDAAKYYERSSAVIKTFNEIEDAPNFHRIFPDEIFCNSEIIDRCITDFQGNLLYFDDDHLTTFGTQLVSNRILDMYAISEPNSNN